VAQQFIDEEILENLNIKLNDAIDGLESPTRERIRDFILSSKGKQLRPSLVAIATKILVEDKDYQEEAMEQSYDSAVAIELLHNMTLIHDDVIDNAPVRRGRKAFHVIHGRDRALHDGDILHAYALTLLKKNPSLNEVLDYAYLVGLGNAIELEDRLNQNFDFDIDHVIRIMRLKTAIVFSGCVKLGCIAAKRKDLFTKRLDDAIVAAGIAFQIQDDYLDILGNPEQFGKVQFWDIQESKRNLFLHFALQTEDSSKVKEIFNKPVGEKTEEEIKFILKVFNQIADKVVDVRNKFFKSAIQELNSIQEELDSDDPEGNDLIDFLIILVQYLVERKK
jgi:geranylgeranyl diphosphate synthase type II